MLADEVEDAGGSEVLQLGLREQIFIWQRRFVVQAKHLAQNEHARFFTLLWERS